VRGSVYQRCSCRDQETRKPLGRKCPKLRNKGHATGWFFRYDAPRGLDGKRRRPEVGPFPTQRAAEEELAATLARLGGGAQVPDRSLLTGAYLDAYIKGKAEPQASHAGHQQGDHQPLLEARAGLPAPSRPSRPSRRRGGPGDDEH
jgi:hypothetical protein